MELGRRGKYLLLPISGERIVAVDDGITVRFSDPGSTLEVRGEITLCLASDPPTRTRAPGLGRHVEPLLGIPIREARAHPRRGELLISFEDGSELVVEDGPYENWSYGKVDPERPGKALRVYGGVGRTTSC
jgi:hypothetical protein